MILLSTDTTANRLIPNAKTSPILEELTGADIMISTAPFPAASEMLIKKHVENGAILIQQKNGMDLVHSAQNQRLTSQLARMYEAGAKHYWQRVILFVGDVKYSNGHAIMNGTDIGAWSQWSGIKLALAFRGAYFHHEPTLDTVPQFLAHIEGALQAWKENKIKEVFPFVDFPDDMPPQDDPLQLPKRVTDWRRPMWELCKVANANIGPEILTNLRNEMLKNGVQDSFFYALDWITSFNPLIPKVKGLGPKRKQAVKDYVGLYPGTDITFMAGEEAPNSMEEE